MNTPSLILAILAVAAVFYAALWLWWQSKLVKESEATAFSDTDRRLMKWGARAALLVGLVGLIVLVQASGLFDISDPFQGQDARSHLSTHSMSPVSAGPPPELKGVRIQPDVGAVAAEHQEQLRRFEGKE